MVAAGIQDAAVVPTERNLPSGESASVGQSEASFGSGLTTAVCLLTAHRKQEQLSRTRGLGTSNRLSGLAAVYEIPVIAAKTVFL